MGAKTLEQILGYVALTGTIQATKTGIPDPLPEGFAGNIKGTVGDTGRYTQVTGQRQLARRVEYGAPAVAAPLKDVAQRDVKLLHTFEKIQIPVLVMAMLRNYTNYDLQKRGIDEVTRQAAAFKQKFVNLRTACRLMALHNGKLWFDSSGNLLPSSSGAFLTIDFGVPALNQGTLGLNTSTGPWGAFGSGAKWDQATTDIPAMIRALKKYALALTGYPLKKVFYGENVPSYLAKNNYVHDYLMRHPQMNAKYLESAELPDLFGLQWVPAYESFFEDPDGVIRHIWGVDSCVFTPEPAGGEWWENMEGTYQVPTTLNVTGDTVATLNSFKEVQGMFGFGLPCFNPPSTFDSFYGDTFLPIIKNGSVVYQATVV